MSWRLIALGTVGIVLGSVLLVTPVDARPLGSTTLVSGNWFDLAVPATASWTGQGVQVTLSWGSPPPDCFRRPTCYSPAPEPTYLLVFDCGGAPCRPGVNYSYLGNTDTARYQGSSGFDAVPGHHYQVWAWDAYNVSSGPAVPVRYGLNTPVLGGFFGAGLIVAGVAGAAEGVRSALVKRRRTVTDARQL